MEPCRRFDNDEVASSQVWSISPRPQALRDAATILGRSPKKDGKGIGAQAEAP